MKSGGRGFARKPGIATAIIIPLLKKGDTSIMDNYRGIALQDIVEKVFAKVIYTKYTQHAPI